MGVQLREDWPLCGTVDSGKVHNYGQMVKQVWGLNPNWFLHFNMTWSSGQLELNTSNCTTVNVKYSISHVRNNDEAMASRHDQYWYFICVFIEHSLFLIKYQRQVSPIFTMTRITLQHRLTGFQLREVLNQKKVWNCTLLKHNTKDVYLKGNWFSWPFTPFWLWNWKTNMSMLILSCTISC